MKEYDYNKLLGKIKEVLGCNSNLALKLKVSERTMSLKLNNKIDFRQTEITDICKILGIQDKEIPVYFFKIKTQND